jgi:hypothetical protein
MSEFHKTPQKERRGTMPIVAAWAFASSSGATTYETTLDDAGVLACNCPGFLFKKKGQARGCKHLRQIEPYAERVRTGSVTAEQVGVWLGIVGTVPSAAKPHPTEKTAALTTSVSAPQSTSSLPPLTERKGRKFDFEE